MKNYKTLYNKGDERFQWSGDDWLPKEKRRRRIRRERNMRDKFGFDRQRRESLF